MKNSQQTWKVIDLLKTTTDYFNSKKIENSRLNAERLLAHQLNISRVDLYVQFERLLSSEELNQFRELVRRRSQNEPLQYILGETEFMGLNFQVSPQVLIPRPETEILVEQVIKTVNELHIDNPKIVDIGTGSGCIAISLAHFLKGSEITATDISSEALNVAQINAEMNQTKNIHFIEHDILTNDPLPVRETDIIVSNPPYISVPEMEELAPEIKGFEPHIALTDFNDGLEFYAKILSLLNNGMHCKFIFMEMNANLKDSIINLTQKFKFDSIEIIPDLNDLPRVFKMKI